MYWKVFAKFYLRMVALGVLFLVEPLLTAGQTRYNSTTWRYYWHTNSWFESHWDNGLPNDESSAWIAPAPAVVIVTNDGATCWQLDVEGQASETYWRPEVRIFNGATMHIGELTLGYSGAMIGYVLVSNGTLNISTAIDSDATAFLGGNGTGMVEVVSGGQLNCRRMYLGRFNSGTSRGILNVFGSGSACHISDGLYYGEWDDKTASACEITIADSGLVTIGDRFEIETPNHTLTITNGGEMQVNQLYFSRAPTLSGGGTLKFNEFTTVPSSFDMDVVVKMGYTGMTRAANFTLQPNDYVSINAPFSVGVQKKATITCQGRLNVNSSMYVGMAETSRVSLVGGTNSISSLLMLATENNSEAHYSNDGGFLDVGTHLYIGEQSPAWFSQTNNARTEINRRMYLGYLDGSKGICTVNGGTLNVGSNILIGGYGDFTSATGLLDVAQGEVTTPEGIYIHPDDILRLSGGKATCKDLYIKNGFLDLQDGTLVINGGMISNVTGELLVDSLSNNASGSPLLVMTNGATVGGNRTIMVGVTNKAGFAVSGYHLNMDRTYGGFKLGLEPGSEGGLTLSGAGSALTLGQNSSVHLGVGGAATIEITDGGQLQVEGVYPAEGIFMAGEDGSEAYMLVRGSGSRLDTGRQLGVGWDGDATLRIEDGGVVSAYRVYLDMMSSGTGRVEVVGTGSLLQATSKVKVGRWDDFGEAVLALSNGTVQVGSGYQLEVYDTGRLEGGGVINGSVTNRSLIDPDYTIGALEINGDLFQDEDAEVQIEVDGAPALGTYDQLSVSSNAYLGGTVTINADDATVQVGMEYPVLLYGSYSNAFNTTNVNYTLPDSHVTAGLVFESGRAIFRVAYEQDTGLSPIHYVSPSGSATWPFTNWATAANTIQDAVDTATDGDTVLVTNGVYDTGESLASGRLCKSRVTIEKPLTVSSVNGPDATFIVGAADNGGHGDNAVRCVYLGYNATLSGFTLTNGHTRTSGDQNLERGGGGVLLRSGSVVSNCVFTGNHSDGLGAGANLHHGGSIYNSVFRANHSDDDGGGAMIEGGLVANCLFHNNTAADNGGGTYIYQHGEIVNCTIVNNHANHDGGGIKFYLGGTNINCILYNNTCDDDGDNWFVDTLGIMEYSCTTPEFTGTGNVTNNPNFLDAANGNYRLRSSSTCIDVGDNAAVLSSHDLDDNDRILNSTVDMGAYEAGQAIWCTNSDATVYGAITAQTIGGTNSETVTGAMWWTNALGSSGGAFAAMTPWTFEEPALAFGSNNLVVYGRNAAGALSYDCARVTRLYDHGPSSPIHYVSTNGANQYPYTNWQQAALVIQDAVDAAGNSDTVLLTNGVYNRGGRALDEQNFTNRVVIGKNIHLTSVNGATNTFIVGASDNGTNGPLATRCLYMSAGTVSGLSITNGFTQATGDWGPYQCGGGVSLNSGGIVSNCIISGCKASKYGGGVIINYDGLVTDCRIEGNRSYNRGGGVSMSGGLLNRCIVRNNYVGGSGIEDGGGLLLFYTGWVRNSLIIQNEAEGGGGGIYSPPDSSYRTLIENCTIISNTAAVGGGLYCYGGTNRNSILYYNVGTNTSESSQNWSHGIDGTSRFEYCCSTPMPTMQAVGCITTAPAFEAATYVRLQSNSPCINAGTNQPSMTGTFDLDGVQRIVDGIVDIGACEWAPLPSYIGTLADQTNALGDSFEYTGPTNSFSDPAQAGLRYEMTLTNGSAAPAWIQIDRATGRIYGTADELGDFPLRIRVYDVLDRTAQGDFFYFMRLCITASAGTHGSISPAGQIYCTTNDTNDFVISADSYYHVNEVRRNNTSLGAITHCTIANITSNETLDASFTADTSAHGTPNWWLASFGLTNGGQSFDEAENGDPDGDDVESWKEYVADTDPTNQTSFFSILGVTNQPQRSFHFQSSTTRLYSLQLCTNLMVATWTNIPGGEPRLGIGGPDNLLDTNTPTENTFYGVGVQLPE